MMFFTKFYCMTLLLSASVSAVIEKYSVGSEDHETKLIMDVMHAGTEGADLVAKLRAALTIAESDAAAIVKPTPPSPTPKPFSKPGKRLINAPTAAAWSGSYYESWRAAESREERAQRIADSFARKAAADQASREKRRMEELQVQLAQTLERERAAAATKVLNDLLKSQNDAREAAAIQIQMATRARLAKAELARRVQAPSDYVTLHSQIKHMEWKLAAAQRKVNGSEAAKKGAAADAALVALEAARAAAKSVLSQDALTALKVTALRRQLADLEGEKIVGEPEAATSGRASRARSM